MTATRLNKQEWTETVNGWSVRHMMDGRVEMRKFFKNTNVTWGAWGSCYEGIISNQGLYPYEFAEIPMTRAEQSAETNAVILGYELYWGSYDPLKYHPQIVGIRPNTTTNKTVAATLVITGLLA